MKSPYVVRKMVDTVCRVRWSPFLTAFTTSIAAYPFASPAAPYTGR